jgi:predicted dehydrogenase
MDPHALLGLAPDAPPVRWGILATGKIARSFVRDLQLVPGAELAACGSRSLAVARAFAEKYGVARAYGSYEELARDPDVDVVYVATPHGRHVEDVTTCLDAGKSVLCEKPLTLDRASAATLVERARSEGRFLAEAMWMRTNPLVREAVELARAGACGPIQQVRADLGFFTPVDPTSRLWDPVLGASAVLDVGVYPITLAHLVLGEPADVTATATLSDLGVDVNGGATLRYADGAVASLTWTQTAWSDARASIAGPDGRIEIAPRFHMPPAFTYSQGFEAEEHTATVVGYGLAHEAAEVMRCLRAGRTESDLLSPETTLSVLGTIDRIRAAFGGGGVGSTAS